MKLYTIIQIGSLCILLQIHSKPLPQLGDSHHVEIEFENSRTHITRAEHLHNHINNVSYTNLMVGMIPGKITIAGASILGFITVEIPKTIMRSEQSSSTSLAEKALGIGVIGAFTWWLIGDELRVIINFKKDMIEFGTKLKTIQTLLDQMEENQEQTHDKIADIEGIIEDCQTSITKIKGHDKRILDQQVALIASLQDVQHNFDAFNEMRKQMGKSPLTTISPCERTSTIKKMSLPTESDNSDSDIDTKDASEAIAATPEQLAYINKTPNPDKLVEQAQALAQKANHFEHIKKIFK